MQSARELIVEPVGLNVETLARPIAWEKLFGNDHPVELEIGMGKGTFLVEQAKARPEINFFGVEYARWFWRYASDRLRRNNCLNARTVRAEANYFLREFISDGTLSAVHIYFPDPWPKKRHHKRRLIQTGFVGEVIRVLKTGGIVRIVTDHAEYFEQIEQVLAASALARRDYIPAQIAPHPNPLPEYRERGQTAEEAEIVGTNFERKYRRAGRAFFSVMSEKIA